MAIGFYEWLQGSGCDFSIGWNRYNQFRDGWTFLACAGWKNERELVNALDGGDDEGISAAKELKEKAKEELVYIATDKDPGEALKKVIEQLKLYYNKQTRAW